MLDSKPYFDGKKPLAFRFGMSEAVSELVAENRSVPDTRPAGCSHWNYPASLPDASVVLVFHNEASSVLRRTVVSVLNRSPPNLLTEVSCLLATLNNRTDSCRCCWWMTTRT